MTTFTDEDLEKLAAQAVSNKPEDPTGQFPTAEHVNRSNTNIQSKGEGVNRLKWAGYSEGRNELIPRDRISSVYPYNQVSRSITGHTIEIDDTPGNERMLIKHADGAGIELAVDGSVYISALKNRIECTGGDQHITIVGDAKLEYQGNLDMKVKGEFNIECNEYNVNVKNNKNEFIGGSETKEVYKGITTTVAENVTNIITGQVTDTILGGQQHNVKGNMDYNINGNVGFYASGEMNVTSEDYVNIASDNVTASANNMTIQGGNGVIGGDSVHIKGQEASFEGSVEAPTFYGNLIGKAKFAGLADKATGADTAGATGSSGTASYPSDPGAPTFVEPTTSKVSDYLTKAAGGIRKVKIDIGNYIRDFIDKSSRYDGISAQSLSTQQIRSKLRDPANRNNQKLVGSLIEEGKLCRNFNNPNPRGVGRLIDGQSTTLRAKRFSDAISSTNDVVHVTRNAVKQFVPDPLYNPMNLGRDAITTITAKTKLSQNISVSKFLGTDDPANIQYIRDEEKKRQILKHLYLQTLILNRITRNQSEFEGVALEVTEGLYRPGKGETITSGSINDLKSKGRAVVYKAVDSEGKSNNTKLFDIAVYLKDNAYFEELILSYDTNDCVNDNPILTGRIIITMPEIDDSFKGTFKREVYTEFNGNRLSQGELVEVLPEKIDIPSDPDGIVLSDGGEYGINLNTLVYTYPDGSKYSYQPDIKIKGTTHPEVTKEAEKNMTLLLNTNYKILQQKFGGKLLINDALPLRKPKTSRTPPSRGGTSQHWTGQAIDISTVNMSNADKTRLVKAAQEAGFTGFGFGRTILHLDLGRKRFWDYNNTTFAGRATGYWFKWVSDNV